MLRCTSKNDLYSFVSSAKEKYGINTGSYPLNVIELCGERNDVDIEYTILKTKGLCGVALLGKKVNTIILNTNRNAKERNYDCAHEIIHLVKHRNLGLREFRCFEGKETNIDNIEWQANEGAAEILVPYKLLLPLIHENRISLNEWSSIYSLINHLSAHFGVKESVITYRLESLKYEIDQFLNGTKLDNLKIISATKQNELGIKIKSINDIAVDMLAKDNARGFDYCDQYCPDITDFGPF